MKAIHLFILFVVVCAIQLFVPTQMILERERVLNEGKAYKFKTEPIDPNDPFRGKYITLDYAISSYETEIEDWNPYEEVYIVIDTDSLGFARIDTVNKEKPKTDKDYIKGVVRFYYEYTNTLDIRFEFDRFYMEETKAPEAETLYREVNRDDLKEAYAIVHVFNGKAVLRDVILDGKPIGSYLD